MASKTAAVLRGLLFISSRNLHKCRASANVLNQVWQTHRSFASTSRDDSATFPDFKVAVFSSKRYVADFLTQPLRSVFPSSTFVEPRLDINSARMAEGCRAVSIFVNDVCDAKVVQQLAGGGVQLVALRCAGYDRVDVKACHEAGIQVVHVPTYSPQSVAEHAVAMMFCLNRNLHQAHVRVSQGNYALSGLVGFEMLGKTVGVLGTGAIGSHAARILKGIGCRVLAHDLNPAQECVQLGVEYLGLDEMLPQCDILTLHWPLLPSTHHIINKERISRMKPGAMLINVSRGGLVETDALCEALERGQIGAVGMDVYEDEDALFFEDWSQYTAQERMRFWDRRLKTLLSYPQVLVTPHSAFLTREALHNIATTTVSSMVDFAAGRPLRNLVQERGHSPKP